MLKFSHLPKLLVILLLCNLSPIKSSSVWLPEDGRFGKEAKACYLPLRINKGPGLVSPSVFEISNHIIQELANDSADARIGSIICLRKSLKTEEDHEELIRAYENALAREDHLAFLEWKLLLGKNREFPLTPFEEKSVGEWLLLRRELVDGIRDLTRDALRFSPKDWGKFEKNWQLELRARYGSLIREREKFLFGLTIESRTSYLQYLTKFSEKTE